MPLSDYEIAAVMTDLIREASASWPEFDRHREAIAARVALLPIRHHSGRDAMRTIAEQDLFQAYVIVMTGHAAD